MKKNNGFFSEVWCCEKPKRQGLDNVIGRISFNTGKKFRIEPEQIIEQVWSVNHREIEKYTKNSNINYLRASREGWNRRYEIEHVNITHKENKTKMINDFILAVQSIEGNRDKIENLLDFIKKIGISEIVLEYMLIGENFKFIDWDTSNDKKVIDTIFQKDNEEIERE